jgi:putative MFS transporter
MSEFVPPQLRGRWIGYLAFITNTAVAASALVGYFAIPTIGWRAMFALAGAGALIVWHARKAMPESPRWLEAKGHLEEADRIITRIETEMGEALPELPPLRELRVSTAKPVSIGVLFTRPVVRRTLIGSLTTVTANVVLYGFLSWLPTFLVIQKLGVASSLRYTMLMSFGAPLGPLIGAFVADRAGRRVGLAASSILAAAVGGAYALAPAMTAATIAGFFLFLVTYLVATLGLVSYVPELFPTEYRLRGAGFCIAVGRMSAMLTTYGVVWAYTRGGVSLILALLGGLLLVQAIIVAVFGISTERRSLEDLSPEFRTVDHHDANPAQPDR